MKTTEFGSNITSDRLRENFSKQFGSKVNLENYDREQLEDIRNKLRTRIFQQEGSAKFNDLLTNETYQKDKAMLELLNTRIKEMLGEQMQKLRNRMDQLSEAKKGTRPPKTKIAAKGSKPDFLDMDKDGDKKEPMKKAVADKKAGPQKGVNPFAKKDSKVKEGKAHPASCNCKECSMMEEPNEGNAFGKAVRDAKADGVQKGEKVKVGGKEYSVKEASPTTRKAATGGTVTKTATGIVHKAGSKGYGNTWDGETQDQAPAKTSKASKTSAEKKADRSRDIKLPPHKGNVTRHSSNHGADRDDGTGDEVKEGKDTSKTDKKKCPPMSHIKKMCQDGKSVAEICKMHSDCDQAELKQMVADCKKKMVKESQYKHNVRFVNESLAFLINEDEEGKAKAITAAGDIVNDYTSWMQRVGQYQTKSMIELADAIRSDFGAAEAEAFKNAVGPALGATLETLTQQREAVSNAVAALAGEAVPPEAMGADPMGAPQEPGMDMSAPDEMNPDMGGDEFGASDAAAGGPEAAGRAMRESREQRRARRLAESHSIIGRLAR
jgi:hypothetical protein